MKKYFLLTVSWYNISGIEGEERTLVIASSLAYVQKPADYLFLFHEANKIFIEKSRIQSPAIIRSELITKNTAEKMRKQLNIAIYGKED